MKLHEQILADLGKNPTPEKMKEIWLKYNVFFGHRPFVDFLRKNGIKVPRPFEKKMI